MLILLPCLLIVPEGLFVSEIFFQDMMNEEAKKKEQFPCVYSDDEGTQTRKTRPATGEHLNYTLLLQTEHTVF